MSKKEEYVIEMLNITKEFPGIKANDNVTLKLRKGEIHALLGENGAGKSTLMSVLFGLYQPEQGIIKKNGKEVKINSPTDANELNIGMVHQHFKLVECFTVLDNIILGAEPNKLGFLKKDEARKKIIELSQKYKLKVEPDALISDISVGMQQRVEILKMLYRDNEILIFDEPTAVLTPQEIDELMEIMRGFTKEGKYPTYHLADAGFFRKVRKGCWFVNSCRGAVHDTRALLEAKSSGIFSEIILDCWENEPDVDRELLNEVSIATPHIAGFSADGKAMATRMCFFGIRFSRLPEVVPPAPLHPIIDLDEFVDYRVERAFLRTFNPEPIDHQLRREPASFEYLRNHYAHPREPKAYQVVHARPEERDILKAIGFRLS